MDEGVADQVDAAVGGKLVEVLVGVRLTGCCQAPEQGSGGAVLEQGERILGSGCCRQGVPHGF